MPRPWLEAPQRNARRFDLLRAHLRAADDVAPAACAARIAELAFLANVIAAGCGIQKRSFTPQEASEAAAAICNLGLENWPVPWRGRDAEFLTRHDLISVFQVGWAVLHRDVCMHAAEHVIRIAADARTRNRELRAGFAALRVDLARECRAGTPWRARRALDVMLMLDQPAWAALVGLIDECPTIHAGMRAAGGSGEIAVDPCTFEFIAENRQIEAVRDFIQRLPERLQ